MPNFPFPMDPPPFLFRVNLRSAAEAQSLSSLPVRLPSSVPPDFRLASFDQLWPDYVDASARQQKVLGDWMLAKYVNATGQALQIFQGFVSIFFDWTQWGPPPDSSGSQTIDGKEVFWVTANPARGALPRKVNDKLVVAEWEKNSDFAYVGWKDGVHPAPPGATGGDSIRFYGLASNVLKVDDLLKVAGSVPRT